MPSAAPIAAAPAEAVAGLRQELAPLFDDLRRFVDRRIAELSAEVHGAVQIVDFTEANLSGQLARLHVQLAGLIAAPSVATRNSGLELEAVVQETEAAANRIMAAAEVIGERLRSNAADPEAVRAIAGEVEAIFEACAFQDLTSQRIRRAIGHLREVDGILTGLMPIAASSVATGVGAVVEPASPDHDLQQDAVDRLLD